LHEKTLLVGIRELTRKTNVIFSKFIICCMQASLQELKNEMGVLGFYKLFKNLKDATKKNPPL